MSKILKYNLFLESNHNLYHGSPHKFNEFNLENFSKTSDMDEHGYGIYLSSSKKVAINHSNGGYIYNVELDNDIYLVDWEGVITQEIIDKMVSTALDENIIDKDTLDKINSIDKSIKNDDNVVIGFIDLRKEIGLDKFKTHRIFDNPDSNSKYPMTFDETYYNISRIIYDNDFKKTSEFFIRCGIDGSYFNEKGVDFTTYVVFDINKIEIIDMENSKVMEYKSFLENKSMDDKFYIMFGGMESSQFKHFFKDIKGTKDENIISEVKYRITDGEEPYKVLADVIDNKLDPDNDQAQFDGRTLAMSLFFDKKEGERDRQYRKKRKEYQKIRRKKTNKKFNKKLKKEMLK
jgi:hypothetical protein